MSEDVELQVDLSAGGDLGQQLQDAANKAAAAAAGIGTVTTAATSLKDILDNLRMPNLSMPGAPSASAGGTAWPGGATVYPSPPTGAPPSGPDATGPLMGFVSALTAATGALGSFQSQLAASGSVAGGGGMGRGGGGAPAGPDMMGWKEGPDGVLYNPKMEAAASGPDEEEGGGGFSMPGIRSMMRTIRMPQMVLNMAAGGLDSVANTINAGSGVNNIATGDATSGGQTAYDMNRSMAESIPIVGNLAKALYTLGDALDGTALRTKAATQVMDDQIFRSQQQTKLFQEQEPINRQLDQQQAEAGFMNRALPGSVTYGAYGAPVGTISEAALPPSGASGAPGAPGAGLTLPSFAPGQNLMPAAGDPNFTQDFQNASRQNQINQGLQSALEKQAGTAGVLAGVKDRAAAVLDAPETMVNVDVNAFAREELQKQVQAAEQATKAASAGSGWGSFLWGATNTEAATEQAQAKQQELQDKLNALNAQPAEKVTLTQRIGDLQNKIAADSGSSDKGTSQDVTDAQKELNSLVQRQLDLQGQAKTAEQELADATRANIDAQGQVNAKKVDQLRLDAEIAQQQLQKLTTVYSAVGAMDEGSQQIALQAAQRLQGGESLQNFAPEELSLLKQTGFGNQIQQAAIAQAEADPNSVAAQLAQMQGLTGTVSEAQNQVVSAEAKVTLQIMLDEKELAKQTADLLGPLLKSIQRTNEEIVNTERRKREVAAAVSQHGAH